MDKLVQYIKKKYLRQKYRRYGWKGHYASWSEAARQCGGYNAANILARIRESCLKVKNGEAVYERDAMLFDRIEYSWPLLAQLLWVAASNRQELAVLDFGGSLGSTYFQNRQYLSVLASLKWSVVEQQAFVQTGKADIRVDALDFFETIDAAISARGQHDVLLLSCVLPYIEKPYELLSQLIDRGFKWIIIENTYFNPGTGNRLTIQWVPPVYYEASYPAWFLDYQQVKDSFSGKYDLIAAYTNDQILYLEGEKVPYQGFVMQSRISYNP